MNMISRTAAIVLGKCVPCLEKNASKFLIRRMELDENLFMYFNKDSYVFAHDPEKKCKTGDVVLIKQLPEKLTRLITFSVEKIVYPMGDIVDPITGKKVVAGQYRDNIEEINKVYGKSSKAFKYEDSPPRGRLEGTKDFTHGSTYIKYHEDGTDQPFGV